MTEPARPDRFGATIRRLRLAQGSTLRSFAKKVGVSPTYLSRIEQDEIAPPAEDTIRGIALALDEDPDTLLGLAGKVSSDLVPIVTARPRELGAFLRAASVLSTEQLLELTDQATKMTRRRLR